MTKLNWDQVGGRRYETGVDHGVLYIPDNQGAYTNGYSWNGLVSVTESPSGAEANPQYADNIKYLNLVSAEDFGGTIEAFTYPDEFEQCDGTATPEAGVAIGQQNRKTFGLSYRTKIGNDLDSDAGYKLHLVYGALAAPSEKAYTTVNDSPEAMTLSWEFSTTAAEVGEINGVQYKPTAILTVDSTKVPAQSLAELENLLYGTEGSDPSLPKPADVVALFSGSTAEVTPVEPTSDGTTITIPSVTGVDYLVDGEVVTGTYTMTESTVVTARPQAGYKFPVVSDDDWYFAFTG